MAVTRRVRDYLARSRTDSDLVCTLDELLPDSFVVGEGSVLFIKGHCWHPASRIARLDIVANGVAYRIFDLNLGRDARFLALVPFPASDAGLQTELLLQARLRSGATSTTTLGVLRLTPHAPGGQETFSGTPPRVAICMTTFNPRIDLFETQVRTIREQTCQDWVCLVSDDCSDAEAFARIQEITRQDPRFRVSQAPERLGFYRNFERCLGLVPSGVDFVALSDHDDRWHADKLDSLLAAFAKDTTLVYSDMNIIDEQGARIADTYWTTRPNRYDDLASLVMANTVTGAASMFRASLLPRMLPFPPPRGLAFHDHWLACAALASGPVGYVDRPLYDYVQHGSNVLGHFAPAQLGTWAEVRRIAGAVALHPARRVRTAVEHWRAAYETEVQKVRLIARTLLLRCGATLTAAQSTALERLARLGESSRSTAWLAARQAQALGRVTPTIGAEAVLLKAVAWRRYARLRGRFGRRKADASGGAPRGEGRRLESVRQVGDKIAPLRLRVSAAAPARVNLLIPTIDFTYFFGGYIAKLNLARRLADRGHRVRIVTVDYCADRASVWREQVRAFEGLSGIFDRVEVALCGDRGQALEVSPRDAFIATTWWTAHIAHAAVQSLNADGFLYLIQEYEPFTFPMGTYAALARESYDFSHRAVFSTELLRGYFRQEKIGVFSDGEAAGDARSTAFENAITPAGPVTERELARSGPRRLLFYARPEPHAARNMFELGVLALSHALAAGAFSGAWEFHGTGTVGGPSRVSLGGGASLDMHSRQTQAEYRGFLKAHDVGLSLMYTPHPSLVPIEMASAGMLVVTNSFANKTPERLRAISTNMIVAEPAIDAIARALSDAAAGAADLARRAAGSHVAWSTRWDESFDEIVMQRIEILLAAGSGTRAG